MGYFSQPWPPWLERKVTWFSDGMACPFWDDLKPGLEHDWMIFPYMYITIYLIWYTYVYIYIHMYVGINNPNCYSLHHFPESQVYHQSVSNYGFKLLIWILAPTWEAMWVVDVSRLELVSRSRCANESSPSWCSVTSWWILWFLQIQLMGHWVSELASKWIIIGIEWVKKSQSLTRNR